MLYSDDEFAVEFVVEFLSLLGQFQCRKQILIFVKFYQISYFMSKHRHILAKMTGDKNVHNTYIYLQIFRKKIWKRVYIFTSLPSRRRGRVIYISRFFLKRKCLRPLWTELFLDIVFMVFITIWSKMTSNPRKKLQIYWFWPF